MNCFLFDPQKLLLTTSCLFPISRQGDTIWAGVAASSSVAFTTPSRDAPNTLFCLISFWPLFLSLLAMENVSAHPTNSTSAVKGTNHPPNIVGCSCIEEEQPQLPKVQDKAWSYPLTNQSYTAVNRSKGDEWRRFHVSWTYLMEPPLHEDSLPEPA